MRTLKKETQMTVAARDGTLYEIMEKLGENDDFRYYGAVSEKFPDQSLILKIVTEKGKNYLLEREAFVLEEMSIEAARIDEEYSKAHNGAKLNYQIGFPNVLDSFVLEEQKDRRILILGLKASNTLSSITPISLIRKVDNARVDPKTSVWILGKLLKIIAFAHDFLRTKVGNLDCENIFIVKENHLVTIFDWSKAIVYSSQIEKKDVMEELRNAVKSVIFILGGDLETGVIPDHEQLEGDGGTYRELLISLLTKNFERVYDTHRYFYENVEKIWKRKYHPYTTIPI